jgi:hypothetical protein
VIAGPGASSKHLLVAALERAVAFAQVHRAALAVAEDLDLDVAGAAEVLLDIDLVVAEGGLRLGARGAEGVLKLRFVSRASCRARRRRRWP